MSPEGEALCAIEIARWKAQKQLLEDELALLNKELIKGKEQKEEGEKEEKEKENEKEKEIEEEEENDKNVHVMPI
jgi:FMN-dependent NADH-azoreductase